MFVIENGSYPDYWTEKLSDALLAGAYPLYAGCPNIGAYLAEDVLTRLDLANFDKSLAAVADAIENSRYEASAQMRQDAKMRLLNEYNLFPVLAALAAAGQSTRLNRTVELQPQSRYSRTLLSRVKQKAKQWIKPQ